MCESISIVVYNTKISDNENIWIKCKFSFLCFSEFGCNEVDNCHENADCVYDQRTRKYTCECMDGFSGDGVYCTDSGEGKITWRQLQGLREK